MTDRPAPSAFRFPLSALALVIVAWALVIPALAPAAEATPSPDGRPWFVVSLPSAERVRFRNPDGSCVQCSLSMAGVACAIPAAENLLWDTEYGPKIRGGSGPDRVKAYCNARAIPAYNVYGASALDWCRWGLRNGHPVAITWSTNHMILACGYSGETLDAESYYAICDNNSPDKIQWIKPDVFRKWFCAFGGSGWCVILKTPPPPGAALYVPWWDAN